MRTTGIFVLLIILTTNSGRCQNTELLFQNDSIQIFKSAAIFRGRYIYNAADDLEKLIKKEETDECKVNYAFQYNPLSLVGNFYSYETWEGGTLGCGVPGSTLAVQTIDLSNGNPISLTQLFTKESVLEAIKSDTWIRKLIQEADIEIGTLDKLDDFINLIYKFRNIRFTANGFAVLSYSKNTGMVSIRFVGKEYVGFGHERHLQLGLLVKPTTEFENELRNRSFFLLGKFANGLTIK